MGLIQNLRGIIGNIFQIGKSGPNIKNNSDVIEFRNNADNDFAVARTKQIQAGANLADIPTILDTYGVIPFIEYSFTGASAPSPGANTSKFGFCHTTGGSYTAGDVVYDNGTSLIKLNVVKHLTTKASVTGTISLIANGFYSKDGSSWVLKGDGSGTSTGMEQVIELSYTYSSTNVDSTTSIANGARITRVENVVSTPFNGTSPTIEVKINGGTPLIVMGTTLSDLKVANQYQQMEISEVGASNAGVVRATVVSSSSSAGAGKVLVFYVSPLS